jgi:hypothetical protein
MLPCIVIDFFFNNQPDALISQIYCHKTLHVSGILFAHHQESGWNSMEFHPDSAWKRSSLTCMKLTSAERTVGELLMVGKEDARNM